MTKNRELFFIDPLTRTIPNNGVTKVIEPRTQEEWNVLRYELESFVCEGEYRLGLERILDTYMASLDKAEQPAVWVSGFYGSGKSHLVRVLEYLWRDVTFPDGATARGLTRLPKSIREYLLELSNAGKRSGGLWSAAGTLGAGLGKSVRLGLLSIIFRSAGLPEQYAPAQFVIWLKQNNYYEQVKAGVEAAGKDFSRELNNLWVSPVLANSLLQAAPDFANEQIQAREFFKTRYPNRSDITDDEMLLTIKEVLALQSDRPDKLPCTLLVFDELQQFVGEDAERTLQVQNIVEACSSRFGSRVLFVATGQSALGKNTQLSKLKGRFNVSIELSDKDVEQVVREVVLRKQEAKKPELQAVLDKSAGEISRHLEESRIGANNSDGEEMILDYPLLPTRRRFWESALRAIDSAGTAGQLRTQLRIIHEAVRETANQPVGYVVAGDFIYDQLKPDMLQSGILLRDIEMTINEQAKKSPDGALRARLLELVFLIGKLPTEGMNVPGVRSTATTLADLLVEDLTAGSAALRQQVTEILTALADEGILMASGDEYRLQTRESADWEQDFKIRYQAMLANDSRLAEARLAEIKTVVEEIHKGLTFTQGQSKTPRKHLPLFVQDTPATEVAYVPVWVRDEWSVSEKTVRDDAQREGISSPIVFVFLPKLEPEELRKALATAAAAKETIEMRRPRTATPEGQEACGAMEARQRSAANRVRAIVLRLVNAARVYQGGGIPVDEGELKASLQAAIQAALFHLFPEFDDADSDAWGKVVKRATEGAADALLALQYQGDADKHPACKKVRDFVGESGKTGKEILKKFMDPPYGWQKDAVDGCLLSLMAGGFLRGSRDSTPVAVKGFNQGQVGVTTFFSEGITISAPQRIAVRKLILSLGINVKPSEEPEMVPVALKQLLALATAAGGEAPLPAVPDTNGVKDLLALGGNEQFVAVYGQREALLAQYNAWTAARSLCQERWPQWELLTKLLPHAKALLVFAAMADQVQAVRQERSLLAAQNPLPPILQELATALRQALKQRVERLATDLQRELAGLEAAPEWQHLPAAEQSAILTAQQLMPLPAPTVGTDEALLIALSDSSLTDWDNRIAALPGRALQARQEAARRLAPKAVTIMPAHATLQTPEDVEAYLAALRTQIMEHIQQERPVIL